MRTTRIVLTGIIAMVEQPDGVAPIEGTALPR